MRGAAEGSRGAWGQVAAALLAACGLGYSLVHAIGGDAYGPEGWPQHLAIGLPLVAAAVIALLGLAGRQPWLALVAGTAAVPMGVVSVVGLPAVIPAAILIALGARDLRGVSGKDWLAGGAILALLVGGFCYLVLHQDAAQWSTPTGSAGSSNVVTTTESTVVFVTVALALAIASGHRLGRTRTASVEPALPTHTRRLG